MSIFSFHLVKTSPLTTAGAFFGPPSDRQIVGLRHAECLSVMTLGAPILSLARLQLHNFAMFAAWEDERALESFMTGTPLGHSLSKGWHVRLKFLRQWGSLSELKSLPPNDNHTDLDLPVVAVTVARLKLSQLARFVQWGKPVEKLVRDHKGTTLALAALRPPRTFCTFSVWRSLREMTEMVHGKGHFPGADRHAKAMIERNRKDFHSEFTTLRFRALSEHGEWMGRSDFIPKGRGPASDQLQIREF